MDRTTVCSKCGQIMEDCVCSNTPLNNLYKAMVKTYDPKPKKP